MRAWTAEEIEALQTDEQARELLEGESPAETAVLRGLYDCRRRRGATIHEALTAVLEMRVAGIASARRLSLYAYVDELRARLRRENERLRAALAVFADEGGWWYGSPEGGVPGVWVTVGDTVRRPWAVAQEALAEATAETCQPPPPCEPAGQAESRTDQFAAGGGDSYEGDGDG